MLNKIDKIFKKYDLDYTIMPFEDKSIIVFLYPYQPFENKVDKLFIDAYYTASNKLYFMIKDIIGDLINNDFNAKQHLGTDLKHLAEESGLSARMHTTLTASKKYGTKIVLGAIDILDVKLEKVNKKESLCNNCFLCVDNCPTKALTKKGFNKNLCIRYNQEFALDFDNVITSKFKNQLWGCDVCQSVCPVNSEIKFKEIPKELDEILDIGKFIGLVLSGKKNMKVLNNYIGYNYNRPMKLLTLAIICATNIGYDLSNFMDRLKAINDERVKLYLKKYRLKYNI